MSSSEEMNKEQTVKKSITDKERLVLCEKLDKELDEFIAGLEKKAYTEGWPEDRWEEEMEKHPFFMTKSLEEGEPLPPLLEGIQQLKYDPAENTAEELATNYKEDGNFNFKYKKYRLAILSYTEGLRAKSINNTLNAELHNNRAAAQFLLKNYRSCMLDCESALKLEPNYLKAIKRLGKCCFELGKLNDAIKWCDKGIDISKGQDKELSELRSKCVNKKKEIERNERRAVITEKLEKQKHEKLKETIKKRGINIIGCKQEDELDMSALEPCFPAAAHCPVSIDENDRLTWPVLFLYPHYGITDLIQYFHEDSTFFEHLQELFALPPEWDSENLFNDVNKLKIYFENENKTKVISVDKNVTLGQVLKFKGFCVRSGTPSFFIVVENSAAEKRIKNFD